MTRPNTAQDAGTDQYPAAPAGQQYGQAYRAPADSQNAPQYRGYAPPAADQTGFLPYPESGREAMNYGRPQPAGAGVEPSGTRTLWILAYVLSAVALLVPFVGFGAIACGAVAWGKGSRRGKVATFVAIAATVVGWFLGALVYLS